MYAYVLLLPEAAYGEQASASLLSEATLMQLRKYYVYLHMGYAYTATLTHIVQLSAGAYANVETLTLRIAKVSPPGTKQLLHSSHIMKLQPRAQYKIYTQIYKYKYANLYIR